MKLILYITMMLRESVGEQEWTALQRIMEIEGYPLLTPGSKVDEAGISWVVSNGGVSWTPSANTLEVHLSRHRPQPQDWNSITPVELDYLYDCGWKANTEESRRMNK